MDGQIKLLRLREVWKKLGVSRSWVYDRWDPKSPRHDPTFPTPIKLGPRTVVIDLEQLEFWVRAHHQNDRRE